MEIIDEGALDKALEGPEKFRRTPPGRQFMRSSMMNSSNNWMLCLQKIFY